MKSLTLRRYTFNLCTLIAFAASTLNAQEPNATPAAPALAEQDKTVTTELPKEPAATEPVVTTTAEPEAPDPAKLRAEELRRFAVTDLSQVDADYHDQGEYAGPIRLNGCDCEIGLQVVALGEGKFDAILYRGGLPGNGYDGTCRLKLSGSRTGEQVVLSGNNLVVYLQTGYAAVAKTPAGERLGFLQPVKRLSQTLGAKPPANAIVLFNGQNTDQFVDAKVTADGLLEVGTETKQLFQNFTIHGEFRIPYMPYARGQDRGNSGFYLQRRYEVQVLDSFGLELQFNDCASLYRFKAPDINMSFPPLRWQTYDITFTAAKFSACGEKLCKANVTVLHNGVIVQNQLQLENKTGNGKPEGPNPMPILLQNHKNPVHYRNIWVVTHDPVTNYQFHCVAASAPSCSGAGCRLHLFRR